MNPHQRRSGLNIAHDKRDRFFNIAVPIRPGFRAESVDPERAPASGEIRGCDGLKCVGGHTLIIAVAG